MKLTEKRKVSRYLLLIIIIGAILRLINLESFSLTNDELSALKRLRFDSFLEILEIGVKQKDMHPAGVQTFLYFWTSLFGDSQVILRLPFVIAGVISIYFTFLIGTKWNNYRTGLIAACFMAVLHYPILYSQLARPYSFGLLFSLIAVYNWSKFVFDNNKGKKLILNFFGWILFSVLCMYTHYYCFLFIGMVGISGIFYIKKEKRFIYLLSGIIMLALYIPHLNIFWYHMNIGGVGGEEGWLGKPDAGWIIDYLYFTINNSRILLILLVIGLILAIKNRRSLLTLNRLALLSIFWFLGLIYIGYLYSIWQNAILQYSIILFAFPYFVIWVSSLIEKSDNKLIPRSSIAILTLGVFSLVIEKGFYTTEHFSSFKNVAGLTDDIGDQLGLNNITFSTNVNSRDYLDYYHTSDIPYEITDLRYDQEMVRFIDVVKKSTKPYFVLSTMEERIIPEVYDVVMSKYPSILNDHKGKGTRFTTFGRKGKRKVLFEKQIDFSDSLYSKDWEINSSKIDTSFGHDSVGVYILDKDNQYGPNITFKISDLPGYQKPDNYLSVEAELISNKANAGLIVFTVHRDGKQIVWESSLIRHFISEEENEGVFWFTRKIEADWKATDQIKIYIWNQDVGNGPINVKNVTVRNYRLGIYTDN